jgi:hypothetical protein
MAQGLADLYAMPVVHAGQGAVAVPGAEVVVHGVPGWDVDRQSRPLPAAAGGAAYRHVPALISAKPHMPQRHTGYPG